MSVGVPDRWTASRWLFIIVIFAAVQVGFIVLFSEKVAPAKPKAARTGVRLLTEPLSDKETVARFFATDPTVFVLANSKGFSGAAWLDMPAQDYAIPDWEDPPRWLGVDVTDLGGVFTNFLQGAGEQSLQIAEKLPPVVNLPQEPAHQPTASRFVIEGELSRRLVSAPPLPVWPNTDILRHSVVQVCMNGRGEVVLARLLSRSGLPAADQKAVSLARELTFKAINQGEGATNLVAGNVTFQWETVAVPSSSEFE